MILTLAAVMNMALQCVGAVPPPESLAAVAKTESGFDTLVIHDNTARLTYRPTSEPEAIAVATKLISQEAHSVDLGLMQVNSANLKAYDLSIENAFKPCESLKTGARILAAFSGYNTGSPSAGFRNGYVQKVVRSAEINKTGKDPKPQPAAATPLPPNDWDVFPDIGGEVNSASTQAPAAPTQAAQQEQPDPGISVVQASQSTEEQN